MKTDLDEIVVHSDKIFEQVKSLVQNEGLNFTMLKYTINEIFNKRDGVRNLHNKFARKTLRVSELEEIAEILNYELVLRKKI